MANSLTLDEQIERHNESARILMKSYESSAAHAAFMAHNAEFSRDRSKYERQVKRFKLKAAQARASIIPPPRFAKEPARRVVKEADGHHCTDDKVKYLPLTDELCAEIAASNTHLSAGQVHHDLLAGKTIYGSFRRYRLEA